MSTTSKSSKKSPDSITEKAREIWLAGLGAFSTAEEEGEKIFAKFVEKGRELEAKGETLEKKAREKMESLTTYVSERTSKISDEVSAKFSEAMPAFIEEKLHSTLEAFGVSSRSEVKDLSDKVDKLVDKVTKLTKQLEDARKQATPGSKV